MCNQTVRYVPLFVRHVIVYRHHMLSSGQPLTLLHSCSTSTNIKYDVVMRNANIDVAAKANTDTRYLLSSRANGVSEN